MDNTFRIEQIRQRIQEKLHPEFLEIIDDSEKHKGHEGAKSGAGHFTVHIMAPTLKEKSLVEAHRLIYQALDDLIPSEIHALKIRLHRPKN